MAYAEFPHFIDRHDDLTEVIILVKKLEEDYNGTLQSITNLSERLTEYESKMTEQIQNIVQVAVPNAVASSIAMYQSQVNSELSNIKTTIRLLDTNLSGQIDTLQKKDSELASSIVSLSSEVEQKYYNLQNQTNNLFDLLNKRIQLTEETLTLDIKSQAVASQEYSYKLFSELYEMVEKIPDSTTNIQNPLQGMEITSVNDFLIDVYNFMLHPNGYTAFQWYFETEITASWWHDENFSAVEWYVDGQKIFNYLKRKDRVFSAISGNYIPLKEAVKELYALMVEKTGNPITASQYDNENLTAANYDSKTITAYDYDWNAVGEESTNV